jgi:hypothetical protein
MSEHTPGTSEAPVEPFPPPYLTSAAPYDGKTGQAGTRFGDSGVSDPRDGAIRTTVPHDLPTGNGTITVTNPAGKSNPTDFAVLPS